jgi:hypothetical protein
MRWLTRLRDVADRWRGVSVPRQEWIAVDGVSDTACLVRAIATTMPRDAMLNIVRPRGTLEAFLRANALPVSRPDEGDYYYPVAGAKMGDLATLVERLAPSPACGTVLVQRHGVDILEAFRRDGGEDVVWLASDLSPEVLAAFRAALAGAARSNGHSPSALPEVRSA